MSETNAGRPEAAAIIWTAQHAPIPEIPSAGRARLRGVLQAAIAAAAGAAVYAFLSHVVGSVVLTVSALILLAALISPLGAYGAIERGFAALGHATGRALTVILMGMIFYLVVTPFGLLFRRGKRDPMRRALDEGLASYWEPRELGRSGSASRTRQF